MHILKWQILAAFFGSLLLFQNGFATEEFEQPAEEEIEEKKPLAPEYPDEGTVVYLHLDSDIDPSATRMVKRGLDRVEETDADVFIMELNTFGGLLDDGEKIRNLLLNAPVPTISFINTNAASAGALISIACSRIYMASGSTIGAATVVNQSGEQAPDKFQSYMRGLMRATAEISGRDPLIAEAMVDENKEIEGVTPAGEVITFTRSEAIEHDYCDGEAENYRDVLEKEGIAHFEVDEIELSAIDHIINFLVHPAVSSFLIMLILGGLYFELQTAGLGIPSMAALLAAVIYFAPLYLEQLATFWDISLFALGVILLAIEVFTLAGFGFIGILGFLCIFSGLMFALIRNDFFDFSMAGTPAIMEAFSTVMAAFVIAVILIFITGAKFIHSRFFNRLALNTTLENSSSSYEKITDYQPELIGKKGITTTKLYPAGKVKIDGEIYDAVSEGKFLDKGEEIIVTEDYQTRIVVRGTKKKDQHGSKDNADRPDEL